jgi:hypothetical protein
VFAVDQRTSALVAHALKLKKRHSKDKQERMRHARTERAKLIVSMRADRIKEKEEEGSGYIGFDGTFESLNDDSEKDEDDETKLNRALYLAALSEFCIYRDNINDIDKEDKESQTKGKGKGKTANLFDISPYCDIEQLSLAIQRRDPLGLGYKDRWGLDLLSRLLSWRPKDRCDHALFIDLFIAILFYIYKYKCFSFQE